MMDNPALPVPVGVFRSIEKECYEDALAGQIKVAKERMGKKNLQSVLESGDTWVVE
jgi:2-oxoglutarate ferredoxin oxidoreductase subunit beta